MLGQFLTASPSFTADEQKIELHQRREDIIFEENIENSQDSDGQGGSETQEEVAREEEEKVEEMEEEEEEEVDEEEEEKEVGLLDWMQKQQERRASLASACARDPG